MRIALAQLNYHIGNFESNTAKIINAVVRAKKEKADLVIFSELAVCGYPPRDFLEFSDFIRLSEQSVNAIAKECNGIAAIVGAPSVNPGKTGKPLYNSAFFLCDGKIKSVHHKGLLPNYDVFDEYRYFEPANEFSVIAYGGLKIALTICEDIWDERGEASRKLYTHWPMEEIIKQSPDMMINIAASPFHYSHPEDRKLILNTNALKYNLPLFYLNHVGGHTELIFDGGSMVIDCNGNIADTMNYFEEDFRIYETDKPYDNNLPLKSKEYTRVERIHHALVLGIRDYFLKSGFNKALLGLSGGIDSAVVLCIAAEALGADNVTTLLLPSQFSSQHSLSDAKKLAENIGCSYQVIPIEELFNSFEQSLNPYFKNLPFNIAEENIQSRIRAVLLMAFSNKFGNILLNTTNKSEAAVGYGTLYGDMCGGLAPLGDVYKTEVYQLAKYINSRKSVIPDHILTKAPSAELRPNQKDSDSLPEYEILDKLLYQYVELCKGPKELIASGFDETLVNKVLKMVNTTEYKRYQTPPILRVSPKAFGMGRRMPIVGKYLS